MATIVLKLFNIVAPDIAVFGEKDFQQFCVVRRLVADLALTAVSLPLAWFLRQDLLRASFAGLFPLPLAPLDQYLLLLFFIPFFGLAIGVAMGALSGKFADYGIDDNFIKQTRDLNLFTGKLFSACIFERAYWNDRKARIDLNTGDGIAGIAKTLLWRR